MYFFFYFIYSCIGLVCSVNYVKLKDNDVHNCHTIKLIAVFTYLTLSFTQNYYFLYNLQ